MFGSLLEPLRQNLDAVRRYANFSSALRDLSINQLRPGAAPLAASVDPLLATAPEPTQWRVLDHCTVVTRSYALFELFIIEVLGSYLEFMASNFKMSDLGLEFVSRYTKGIGQILVDQNKRQYAELSIPAVIAGAYGAITDSAGYSIQSEALLRAEQNLRMAEVGRLFAQCGLQDAGGWVKKHPLISDYFAVGGRLTETAESMLATLVEYRNSAAHRTVDEVLRTEVLVEIVDFIEKLATALAELVQYDVLRRGQVSGSVIKLGEISERFLGGSVIVFAMNRGTISVGDELYLSKNGASTLVRVLGVRVDNVPVDGLSASGEIEVGAQIDGVGRVGWNVLKLA